MARLPARYRPRLVRLRDGRTVTLRAINTTDAPEIVQAFERLDKESRYSRFMQHKRQLDPAALARGVDPRPGRDFAFVATVPATDGIDIVGAAQYVRVDAGDPTTCEFAITVATDWRGLRPRRATACQPDSPCPAGRVHQHGRLGDRGQLEDAGPGAQARVHGEPGER